MTLTPVENSTYNFLRKILLKDPSEPADLLDGLVKSLLSKSVAREIAHHEARIQELMSGPSRAIVDDTSLPEFLRVRKPTGGIGVSPVNKLFDPSQFRVGFDPATEADHDVDIIVRSRAEYIAEQEAFNRVALELKEANAKLAAIAEAKVCQIGMPTNSERFIENCNRLYAAINGNTQHQVDSTTPIDIIYMLASQLIEDLVSTPASASDSGQAVDLISEPEPDSLLFRDRFRETIGPLLVKLGLFAEGSACSEQLLHALIAFLENKGRILQSADDIFRPVLKENQPSYDYDSLDTWDLFLIAKCLIIDQASALATATETPAPGSDKAKITAAVDALLAFCVSNELYQRPEAEQPSRSLPDLLTFVLTFVLTSYQADLDAKQRPTLEESEAGSGVNDFMRGDQKPLSQTGESVSEPASEPVGADPAAPAADEKPGGQTDVHAAPESESFQRNTNWRFDFSPSKAIWLIEQSLAGKSNEDLVASSGCGPEAKAFLGPRHWTIKKLLKMTDDERTTELKSLYVHYCEQAKATPSEAFLDQLCIRGTVRDKSKEPASIGTEAQLPKAPDLVVEPPGPNVGKEAPGNYVPLSRYHGEHHRTAEWPYPFHPHVARLLVRQVASGSTPLFAVQSNFAGEPGRQLIESASWAINDMRAAQTENERNRIIYDLYLVWCRQADVQP